MFWHQGALEHWLLERQQRLNGKCRHHAFPEISRQNLKRRKNRLFCLMFWISAGLYTYMALTWGVTLKRGAYSVGGDAFMLSKV
jgi:hypothetical protein